MTGPTDLQIRITSPDLDAVELADIGRNLREELLTREVESVRPADGGPPPPGAKAIETIAFGALVVSMSPSLIGAVIDVVSSWLRRQTVNIEIEIGEQRLRGSVTADQREAIIAAYLRRIGSASE